MVLVAYRHGLRAAELVDLRLDQVDFETATLHVRRVKKGTPATHPVLGDCRLEPWYEDSSAGALVRSVLPENSRYPGQDQIAPHDSKSKYYSQDVAQNGQGKS
jgi:hypothetical protein